MLVESFRVVTARLIPRGLRCKQALLRASLILAVLGLPACGGSTAPKNQGDWQTVSGTGFTFQAPKGWKVEHAKNRVSATSGSEVVQVATFALMKAYDDTLFARVAAELRLRIDDIARETGGKLTGQRTVTADGVRSHAYDVTAGKQVDEYTFVLSGKRESLLLCRRASSDGAGVCSQLVTSFARR
jgi:predicted Zn-dependent protease